MDSPTSPPAPAVPAVLDAEAPPGALARLGRLLPGVDGLVRFAYRTAAASAVSAVVVVAAVADALAGSAGVPWALAAGALLVLWIPAGAAALAGWTLSDLARLPGQLRDAAAGAAGRTRDVRRKRSRLGASLRALWAARGLAAVSRGAWLRALGAVRFVRLASLPFALALGGLFALNGVVVAAGVVALLVLLF